MCEVVNIHQEKYDVYIGRPSKWGNPFSHLQVSKAKFKVDTIDEAIERYEEYLLNNEDLMKSLPELKYKILGCHCQKKCHGFILKKYVDLLEQQDEREKLLDF